MEKKESRILGIIGALLGGLLATLPWILVYIYGNMMFSALAIIIAFVALKGYQLCHGKQDKYLALTISTVSIISVTVATLLIIPFGLLYKEGYQVSWYNFQLLYENSEFVSAILKDYAIAVLFTILGISGIIKTIKEQHGSVKLSKKTKKTKNSEEKEEEE